MAKTNSELNLDEMTRENGHAPVSNHDEWVCQQVENRLEKKAAGKAVYHELREVADELGMYRFRP